VTDRYVCIHAHFYQPPRENPWLEAIEIQDSAYPYHDWNERVTAECYAPNAAARILDGEQKIIDIVNNYAKISFDFGPTLISWIEDKAPRLYKAIQSADKESCERFGGHGAAMAQAYNHMIMPLANDRDKSTQTIWGIRDFEHRFGRYPEGMWLPEAAVDLQALETLAAQKIRFTVLPQHAAKRVRPIGKTNWKDVSGGQIDPSRAYLCNLPSGRSIVLFFFDGPISHAVAFENILMRGEDFAQRLMGGFSDGRKWPQLTNIATDGETYGHHRAHGDMALSYALRYIETEKLANLTAYADFLEKHAPTHEVDIVENTSWSCVHGVERWRSNCGCNSGRPGWNQEWRTPLRAAFDWLRDTLTPKYEQNASAVFAEPWRARDEYISVILDRSRDNIDRFLREQAGRELKECEKVHALKLMELQRHLMLMYTSCGWFFDELSGLETVQAIQYSGRAVQLAQSLFHDDKIEQEYVDKLAAAHSNIPEHSDGKKIYEIFVRPAMLDLNKVGAHYAISSLFEAYPPHSQTYCYQIDQEDHTILSSGKSRVSVGRIRITSDITLDSARVTFGAVHLGDHYVTGGVREFVSVEVYKDTAERITKAFESGDFTDLIRAIDVAFGSGSYSLKLLFRDEQRKILQIILNSALEEAESSYRQLYDSRAPLMRFVAAHGIPHIRHFQAAAEVTLNSELRRAIEAENVNVDLVRALMEEARAVHVNLDAATLEFALRRKLQSMAEDWEQHPCDLEKIGSLESAVKLARSFPFEVRLWEIQNVYHSVLTMSANGHKPEGAGCEVPEWQQRFRSLGEQLGMRMS
jgi:alpha-amylase/alpha-mannosidase (GH57 family)